MLIDLTQKDLQTLIYFINEDIHNCEINIKNIEDSEKVEVYKLANALRDRITMLSDLKSKLEGAREVLENE